LCTSAGLGPDTASALADGLLAAQLAASDDAPLPPQQLADLVWLGMDATTLDRLATVAVLLPQATPVNLNTATREVLAAVVPGLDLGSADRLVQSRVRTPLRSLADAVAIVGAGPKLQERDVDVKSSYFEVRGQLRLENRVLESRSLVERRSGLQVLAIQRQQQASLLPAVR
jgi:general secretion pathway protein K